MYSTRPGCALATVIAVVWWLAAAPQAHAGPAEDHYAIAAGHYAQQRYEPAIAEFETFLTQHSDSGLAPNARFFQAESHLQLGAYEKAAAGFAKFSADYPQHRLAAMAGFRQGEAAYLQGKFAAALPKLAGFVAAHPTDKLCVFALPYLGDCQLELGDPQAAQKNYQLALKNYPTGVLAGECRLGLGRAAEALGELEEARRFYEFLAVRDEQTCSSEAKLRLGKLLVSQQRFADAVTHLQPLADAKEASPQRTPARYWLGQALIQQKNQHAKGVEIWRLAIEEDGRHSLVPEIRFALAQALQSKQDVSAAHEQFVAIVKDTPHSKLADNALAALVDISLDAEDWPAADKLCEQFRADYADSELLDDVREAQAHAWLQLDRATDAVKLLSTLAAKHSPHQARQQYLLVMAQLAAEQVTEARVTLAAIDREKLTPQMEAGLLAADGLSLVALKQPQAALVPLRKYLHDHADGTDAARCHAQLIVALVQLGEFEEAKTAWEKFAEQPTDTLGLLPVTLYLAESAYNAKQHDVSRAAFEYLSKDKLPESYRQKATAGLAWIAQATSSPQKSVEKLDQFIAQQPQSPQASAAALARAQNFERLGESEQALAAYLQVIEKYPTSAQIPTAMLAAARLHDEREQDREADVLLARLVAEHREFKYFDAALCQWSYVLMDLNRDTEAAARLQQLHDDYPQSRFWGDATYRLAELKLRGKQSTAATALLKELIAAESAKELWPHALYLQGQIAASEQKWSEVLGPLTQLTTDYPQHELRPLAEYWLAEAEYRTGKLQEAGARLADLSERVEKLNEPWLAMIPLRQAQVLAHEKRWEEAEKLASGIAAKYPDFRQQYEVDYLLGRCLGAQAKFADARTAYERVLRSTIGGRSETAAMAQWMIGETYFQQERYDDAIKAYHRVERLFAYPRWQAASLLQAGKCHETQGHWLEAIQLYAQVMKDFPQTDFTAEAAQRLRVAEQRASSARMR